HGHRGPTCRRPVDRRATEGQVHRRHLGVGNQRHEQSGDRHVQLRRQPDQSSREQPGPGGQEVTMTRRIVLISAAITLVLMAAWYLLLWKPQSKDLTSARQAQVSAEQQVSNLQIQTAGLQALAKKEPADRAALA